MVQQYKASGFGPLSIFHRAFLVRSARPFTLSFLLYHLMTLGTQQAQPHSSSASLVTRKGRPNVATPCHRQLQTSPREAQAHKSGPRLRKAQLSSTNGLARSEMGVQLSLQASQVLMLFTEVHEALNGNWRDEAYLQ